MSPSIWQILIVVLILLIFFGPKRLPDLGRSLAETIKGFKKGMRDDEIDVTGSTKNEQLDSSAPGESVSQKQKETQTKT